MKGYIATRTHLLLFDGPLRGITAIDDDQIFLFDPSIASFEAAAKQARLPLSSSTYRLLLIQALQHRIVLIESHDPSATIPRVNHPGMTP